MTKEDLIKIIDYYPDQMSGEDIMIYLVSKMILMKPTIIPRFIEDISAALDTVYRRMLSTISVSKERAWYLSTYLDGRMYPEEVAKKPEYIEIQKGHADYIVERCNEALGEKKFDNERKTNYNNN